MFRRRNSIHPIDIKKGKMSQDVKKRYNAITYIFFIPKVSTALSIPIVTGNRSLLSNAFFLFFAQVAFFLEQTCSF